MTFVTKFVKTVLKQKFELIQIYNIFHYLLKFHGLTAYRIVSKNGFYYSQNSMESIIIIVTIFTLTIISYVLSIQATLNGVLGDFVSRLTLMMHLINISLNIVAYLIIFILTCHLRNFILKDAFQLSEINKKSSELSNSNSNTINCLSILTICPSIAVGLYMTIYNFVYATKTLGSSAYFITLIYTVPFMVSNILMKEFEFFLYAIKNEFRNINGQLFEMRWRNKYENNQKTCKLTKVLDLHCKLCEKLEDVNDHFQSIFLIIFVTLLFSMCQGALVVVLILCNVLDEQNTTLIPDLFSILVNIYLIVIPYEFVNVIVFFHISEKCVEKVSMFK